LFSLFQAKTLPNLKNGAIAWIYLFLTKTPRNNLPRYPRAPGASCTFYLTALPIRQGKPLVYSGRFWHKMLRFAFFIIGEKPENLSGLIDR
jgi:hypothetical protein